ncbi:MAG: aminotransferase class I/II-fold pyridoxal phosphate-dependent enzyme, partial [Deltaproteobacteria bacterium]
MATTVAKPLQGGQWPAKASLRAAQTPVDIGCPAPHQGTPQAVCRHRIPGRGRRRRRPTVETILQPGPFVSRLVPYLVPLDSPRIDLPLGVTERPVPSADLRASNFALDAESLARYPDGRSLEAVLAARLGTTPDQVMVTAGADEALDRAFRAMLTPNDNLVVATPTFEMVAHYANLIGAEVLAVPWEPGGLPTDAMLAAVTPKTKVVVVVSPNNPTGAVATGADIRRLSGGAPHALVL